MSSLYFTFIVQMFSKLDSMAVEGHLPSAQNLLRFVINIRLVLKTQLELQIFNLKVEKWEWHMKLRSISELPFWRTLRFPKKRWAIQMKFYLK